MNQKLEWTQSIDLKGVGWLNWAFLQSTLSWADLFNVVHQIKKQDKRINSWTVLIIPSVCLPS